MYSHGEVGLRHPLQAIPQRRAKGVHCGIPSYCSANELVIEAILEQSTRLDDYALIEATANQVNQFGGYTGMTPANFKEFVENIANIAGFDRAKLILGGDHLGPLTWQGEFADIAMQKADELVRSYVLAGFTKIHLDTSMKLGDDSKSSPLSVDVIADRGARLCKAAEQAYLELCEATQYAMPPVYVIGSEVPVPGGQKEDEEGVQVTSPEDFIETVETYRKAFQAAGLADAWERVIAVVVQPGVEFGDSSVHRYSRSAASALCESLRKYPGLVFEGHSTDYQTPEHLGEMTEDGIAILKVGPALTFALRECFYSLEKIETELITNEEQRSNFADILEQEMLARPENWAKHYHGTSAQTHIARKYSLSDRSRYYLGSPTVQAAAARLCANIDSVQIPMGMLHQYLPAQYAGAADGRLKLSAKELCKDSVAQVIGEYNYAVRKKH